MKRAELVLVAIFLMAGSVGAEGPRPMGGQFQVNSYTTSYQQNPSVAVAPRGAGRSGQFVMVWSSFDCPIHCVPIVSFVEWTT